ncbi:circadian clock KaiB family protein [Roseofilum reptotaenium CS-1145]|uniref:Circadian clock protein KaiB n=1 Tax=Roseofilum reptotaenium AO1-A TaxID=1925591 RepID=A0A1L9QMM9_9CYAN|nr:MULTISPECIES: circadian clock KaiB family protein [Roseofilum]MBP0030171.1 circadian clock KaiB family protein [Roseofilum sp. Guam]MDB9517637.1 circadian clock KaiB family protein [Roseofilum reptotaenium CS-1145]OJJ22701.1 circadian clock protein KaiB [Roseofilum reptotaenium AO1-A]
MHYYLLKLYITGNTPKSQRAIANLIEICNTQLEDQYELKIIDVLEEPELAEMERILVTPTLIKQLPQPIQRIIGDLSNADTVLLGLDLIPEKRDNNRKES